MNAVSSNAARTRCAASRSLASSATPPSDRPRWAYCPNGSVQAIVEQVGPTELLCGQLEIMPVRVVGVNPYGGRLNTFSVEVRHLRRLQEVQS